ncbi:MAG: 2-keto-4-pentenoate hydratase [Bdellovibrionota bacterium]
MADSQFISQASELLWKARTGLHQCDPLTARPEPFTIADAYKVSETNLKRRVEQGKARLIGKKIGLTSRAVQKQLGVSEPDFGYLTSDMNVPLGETVRTSGLLQPKVEGETAFVLKRSLRGPGITVADVIRATDFVLPCIEIIDSRVKDWKIKIQDTVADNASSALIVLGTEPRRLREVDLRLAGMALRIDGEVISSGSGAACLDHPCLAVAWLANKLGEFGDSLKAGEVILSGAFGPVVPVSGGEHVEVEIGGLGRVACHFERRGD